MAAQDYQLIKTLPLVNKGETVGTLQLCFNLQTFNDTSFDNDIKSLKQFGIENRILDVLNNKEFYDSKLLQSRNNSKPVSFSSLRTNRSKEELTSDYLMGGLLIFFIQINFNFFIKICFYILVITR